MFRLSSINMPNVQAKCVIQLDTIISSVGTTMSAETLWFTSAIVATVVCFIRIVPLDCRTSQLLTNDTSATNNVNNNSDTTAAAATAATPEVNNNDDTILALCYRASIGNHWNHLLRSNGAVQSNVTMWKLAVVFSISATDVSCCQYRSFSPYRTSEITRLRCVSTVSVCASRNMRVTPTIVTSISSRSASPRTRHRLWVAS